jgi:hypothetical protein
MRPPDLSVARRDLAEWGEPLIAERLSEFYAACFDGDQQWAHSMTLQHCRLWRNLFLQESIRAQNARRELLRLGGLVGLDSQMFDQIDRALLDELADAVATRFHRSPATARDYSRSLMRAASSLAEARLVA